MQRRDEILIRKILGEIDFAVRRIDMLNIFDFLEDEDAQHAVGMAAINVGELIKHISDELKGKTPEIPWRQAAGLRDVAAHAYDTINMEDLYKTIKEDFPKLKVQIAQIGEKNGKNSNNR